MFNALWFLLGISLSFNFFLWWRNDDLNSALEAAMSDALEAEAKKESENADGS